MGFVFDPVEIASKMNPNMKCPWFHSRRGGQDGMDTYWECDLYQWECDEHLSHCNEQCRGYLEAIKQKNMAVPIEEPAAPPDNLSWDELNLINSVMHQQEEQPIPDIIEGECKGCKWDTSDCLHCKRFDLRNYYDKYERDIPAGMVSIADELQFIDKNIELKMEREGYTRGVISVEELKRWLATHRSEKHE